MSFRTLFFRDKQVQSVSIVSFYDVRWTSRQSEWSHDTQPEIRTFTTKEEAEAFRDALVDAFKLIKHTGGRTSVRLIKQEDS